MRSIREDKFYSMNSLASNLADIGTIYSNGFGIEHNDECKTSLRDVKKSIDNYIDSELNYRSKIGIVCKYEEIIKLRENLTDASHSYVIDEAIALFSSSLSLLHFNVIPKGSLNIGDKFRDKFIRDTSLFVIVDESYKGLKFTEIMNFYKIGLTKIIIRVDDLNPLTSSNIRTSLEKTLDNVQVEEDDFSKSDKEIINSVKRVLFYGNKNKFIKYCETYKVKEVQFYNYNSDTRELEKY